MRADLWYQVAFRQPHGEGYAEWIVWRRKIKVGDREGDWRVFHIYTGVGLGDCPLCGQRLNHPESTRHSQFKGICV